MQDPNQRYARSYSESELRRKLARYARAAGEEVVEKVYGILLLLNFLKYGSSFIYSRKSCIHPMFHL